MSEDYKGLNLVDLLELLKPIQQPDPVSMWPQTQGWIWLTLVAGGGILMVVQRMRHSWYRNAYRRAALEEVKHAGGDAALLASILRRTALAAYPRSSVAGLFGSDWLDFLDRSYGGTDFSSGTGQVLVESPYGRAEFCDGLDQLVTTWIKRHRPMQEDPA